MVWRSATWCGVASRGVAVWTWQVPVPHFLWRGVMRSIFSGASRKLFYFAIFAAVITLLVYCLV